MESNAYLVAGKRCCVIDPGMRAERVINHIRDYHIGIDVLINTHSHWDHCAANPGVLSQGGISARIHQLEASALESGDDSMQLAHLLGGEPVAHKVDMTLADGDIVDLEGVSLEVVHTPGHTPGSICLFESESGTLFSGDTVFADSVGRTDFKGGNHRDLSSSIERLIEFVFARGVKTILPGHGPAADPADLGGIYESQF